MLMKGSHAPKGGSLDHTLLQQLLHNECDMHCDVLCRYFRCLQIYGSQMRNVECYCRSSIPCYGFTN